MAKKKAATKAARPAARAAKNARSAVKAAVKKTARTLKTARKAVGKVATKAGRKASAAKKVVARKAKAGLKQAKRQVAGAKAAATKELKKTKRSSAGRIASLTRKAKAAQKKAKASLAANKAVVTRRVKAAGKTVIKAVAPKLVFRKAVKVVARTLAKVAPVVAKAKVAVAPKAAQAAPVSKKPNLDRPRRTVADVHSIPSSLDMNRSASAARSGRAELAQELKQHTSSSPALTAGDVDADWQSAESTGDEAPGGDNPTPDQDVVEEIGRALGVEYADGEELQGGDEIADRDKHRWELDPASKEDFEEDR